MTLLISGSESILTEDVAKKGILRVTLILFLITHFDLFMLPFTAILKAKAALLEKEAWGHLAASLAGSKTSGLWDLLEDLFGEISEAEEEGSPPPRRSCSEDQPSTSGLGPSLLTSTSTIPQPATSKTTVIFPMNKSSLHDSVIKPEYPPVHEKLPIIMLYIFVVFSVVIGPRVGILFVPMFIRNIYTVCMGVPIVSIGFSPLMHGPNTFVLTILVFLCLWK